MVVSIEAAELFPTGRTFQLRVYANDGGYVRLHGFLKKDVEQVAVLTNEALDVEVEQKDVTTKGVSWGRLDMQEKSVKFLSHDSTKTMFEVPYVEIAQSQMQGKNLLALELAQDENAANEEECLTEIRFFIPVLPSTVESQLPLNIAKKIADLAKIGDNTANSLFVFNQVMFIVPRMKMDIIAHKDYAKLRGPSSSFNLLYKNIQHFFLLQRPDSHIVIVVCLR